jgi:DNA-binding CsgD family transcriptional regulator
MLTNERYYNLAIQLVNKGGGLTSQSHAGLTETDKTKIQESISFTEKLFPEVVVSLCTAVHKEIGYVSRNSDDVLGFSSEYLKSLTPERYIKLIHENDIKGFKSCLEYVLNKKIYLQDGYRVIFYYRMTNSQGAVVCVEDERVALQNAEGRYEHFVLLRNITGNESFRGTRVKIYKRWKDKYLLLQEYFSGMEKNDLTPRQRDIIESVLMGLSNQEIADKLNLSIYTVKNHKQALFKKLGIGTSLALTSLMKNANRSGTRELVGNLV